LDRGAVVAAGTGKRMRQDDGVGGVGVSADGPVEDLAPVVALGRALPIQRSQTAFAGVLVEVIRAGGGD
jgi:hypothetical protein